MKILGIDPGTATTGFGLVKTDGHGKEALAWGLIETDKEIVPEKRLEDIFRQTTAILQKLNPDVLAIEKIFFATNAKTVISVSQAQGVMLLAASQAKVKVAQYAPGTIKKTVTGDGRAVKEAVQKAVRVALGRKVRSQKRARTHFDNAADALAIALCHIIKCQSGKKVSNDGRL